MNWPHDMSERDNSTEDGSSFCGVIDQPTGAVAETSFIQDDHLQHDDDVDDTTPPIDDMPGQPLVTRWSWYTLLGPRRRRSE